MTTVSVPPTKNEPNEREAFETFIINSNIGACLTPNADKEFEYYYSPKTEASWVVWQHQQARIDVLTNDRADLEYKCMELETQVEFMLSVKVDDDKQLDDLKTELNSTHEIALGAFAIKDNQFKALKSKLTIALDAFNAVKECSGTSQLQWHISDKALNQINKLSGKGE
jgi:hypothetical protein